MKTADTKLIEQLKWRYATKRFDSSKKVSRDDMEELLEIIRLSPSSYGLQPFKIIVIEDADIRKKLQKFSWDQPQIVESSHLLVFCHEINIDESHIDNYIENISTTRGIALSDLKEFKTVMVKNIASGSSSANSIWASRQAYLALGILLSGCAMKEIDACPMEGFESEKYDEILNLKEKGLKSVCLAAIGYRSENDNYQHLKKVRKSKEDLYEFI